MKRIVQLLIVSVILLCNICSLECKGEDKNEIRDFITKYYLSPEPSKAPEYLKQVIGEIEANDPNNKFRVYLGLYPFCRIASLDYSVVDKYIEMYNGPDKKYCDYIIKVFELGMDEDVFNNIMAKRKDDPNSFNIQLLKDEFVKYSDANKFIEELPSANLTNLSVIAFMWIEYYITGNQAVIEKMLSVYDADYKLDVNEPIELGEYKLTKQQYLDYMRSSTKRAMISNGDNDKYLLKIFKDLYKKYDGPKKQMLMEVIDTIDATFSIERLMKNEAGKEKQLEGAKAWAVAASAILIERNRARHNYLSPDEITPINIRQTRGILDEWWGIRDKDGLLHDLEGLDNGGHRKSFQERMRLIINLTDEEFNQLVAKYSDDKEAQQEFLIARKYYKELGNKNIMAWDYSRYIFLCRYGYTCGYITEEEAWKKIMYAARILQKTFDSWEDLGRNYLIGREFWSYKWTQEAGTEYYDAYHRLLTMPSSPWNKIPWDTNLN